MSWTSFFEVVLQNKQSVLRQLHVQSPLLNSLYLPPFYSTVLHRTFKTCTRFCVHVFFPVFLPENLTSSPAGSSFAVFCFYHFLRCTKKAWKHMHPHVGKGLNAKRALFEPSNYTPQHQLHQLQTWPKTGFRTGFLFFGLLLCSVREPSSTFGFLRGLWSTSTPRSLHLEKPRLLKRAKILGITKTKSQKASIEHSSV